MNKSKAQFLLNETATRTQYGALCWRVQKGVVQALLVTSRDTGRWVIPKGWPVPGMTPQGSAGREAWEEAGVVGEVGPLCIGVFGYDKVMLPGKSVPCMVSVYPIHVKRLLDRFPERKERRRKWFPLEAAAAKVDETELRAILMRFHPTIPHFDPGESAKPTQPS